MSSEPFSFDLNLSYHFEQNKRRIIFADGVSYSIDEVVTIARDRLTKDDIQAIHLVKKLFDGQLETHHNVTNQFVNESECESEEFPKPKEKTSPSLEDLASEFGPPPILQ